jgi:hypothetical protein
LELEAEVKKGEEWVMVKKAAPKDAGSEFLGEI